MAQDPASLAERLTAWFEGARRDLPWRRTRDPYAIWVSEIMLQQTRVEAVRDAYLRFLGRFPDVGSLAAADDDTLLLAWKGLGYYRRARLLREAAQRVVAEHDGRVPDDPSAFGALPGVGPYTKGAVLSLAFGAALPAIDGNVERVACRLLGLDADPKQRQARDRIADLIASLHEHAPPGAVNEALMELGATLCLPKGARCLACPWQSPCAARAQGRVAELPRTRPRAAPTDVTTQVLAVVRDGLLLARRIPAGEVNEGQLCLPGLGLPVPAAAELASHVATQHNLVGEVGERLTSVRHSITRYRIRIDVHAFSPVPPRQRPGHGLRWADPRAAALPWSTVARKVVRSLAPFFQTRGA